jgi:haloalkane dehalogenase
MSNMDIYRTPDDRFADLPGFPFDPHYEQVEDLRIHYVDEGSGDPVVLVHGEPTWAYLYRKVIPGLTDRARVVAPDLPGFGRSDKPTDRAFYTYERHVAVFTSVMEALDLHEITMVVHDWGGAIGLRFAAEHPDRVARLVVLNTGIYSPSPRWPTPGFLAWRNFAERTGLDLPVGFIVQSGCLVELPADVIAAYDAPFPVPEAKTGPAVFPLIVPLATTDPGAQEMIQTRKILSGWDKPALVLFADSDRMFPPGVAKAMARLLPTAGEPEILSGAAHFLQEDRGEEIAARISRFLDQS